MTPEIRVRAVNSAPPRAEGRYVLYWMTAFRRTGWNYSLDRALEWCRELKRPLLVFEGIRSDYRWASDRLHRFCIDGMAANAAGLAGIAAATYYPYVEPERGAGKGLLQALAAEACVVVTDDFPCFFHPRMIAAAGQQLSITLEAVDSNGLMPLRAADKIYSRAVDFRRYVQKTFREHVDQAPKSHPFRGLQLPPAPALPAAVGKRWAPASEALLRGEESLSSLPIDHMVTVVTDTPGGSAEAERRLSHFLAHLTNYGDDRNRPEEQATSGLSPYLHWGHVSIHEVFWRLAEQEGWSPTDMGSKATAKREGWWGMSPDAESFLDEALTWRELGYNMTSQRDDYDQYASLPEWAKQTLADHKDDPREHVYSLETLERAETHDRLWNAAQGQLVREGKIHNYLRMLWGKKVLQWKRDPQQAVEELLHLNNKYGLDGRNPNSYSGVFWVFGRYDRAWGPERKIFGKVRYMTSENTARKYRVKNYMDRYAPQRGTKDLFA